jgi:hypothetical protein
VDHLYHLVQRLQEEESFERKRKDTKERKNSIAFPQEDEIDFLITIFNSINIV